MEVPHIPHHHLPPPCFFGAQPDQQRTPTLGPKSRNGVQFHHQLIKIDRKYKLLLNFYYYYFYPLGSTVSTKLVLIKHMVLQPLLCCGSHGGLVACGAYTLLRQWCVCGGGGSAVERRGDSKLGVCLV